MCFTTSIDNNSIYFKAEQSTVQDFKDWLALLYKSGVPMVLEYVLASEDIEAYTNEQQIAWNKIKELQSYKNTTIFSLSADDVNPNIRMKYCVDDRVAINSKLDELEQAIAALGNNV